MGVDGRGESMEIKHRFLHTGQKVLYYGTQILFVPLPSDSPPLLTWYLEWRKGGFCFEEDTGQYGSMVEDCQVEENKLQSVRDSARQ